MFCYTEVTQKMTSKSKKSHERKMDGLSLPDVVKHLLKESGILRWDPHEGTYEVLHGEKFESRLSILVNSYHDATSEANN